jgi:hypothetical protein
MNTLWEDDSVRASLALCHLKKRFLYETRPDIFPEGFLTFSEMELWERFYEQLHDKRH